MNFRYIQGDWKDFYEAPDEAMLLVIDTCGRKYFTDIFPEPGGKYWSELSSHGVWGNAIKPDAFTLIAAREKLAEWDGEGLPPVGCECEYETKFDGWQPVRIELIKSEGIAFTWLSNSQAYNGLDCVGVQKSGSFRPISSEADKKKEAVEKAIADALFKDGDFDYAEALRLSTFVYGAISRNEIPHIRID